MYMDVGVYVLMYVCDVLGICDVWICVSLCIHVMYMYVCINV